MNVYYICALKNPSYIKGVAIQYYLIYSKADNNISQGSVATCLRCGETFNNRTAIFIAQFDSENRSIFDTKNLVVCFLDHSVALDATEFDGKIL